MGCSVELSLCCCLLLYSTISWRDAIICLETLQVPFEGIFMVAKMHKTVLTLVTLSRGDILSYFLSIFVYRYFFNIPPFIENHSIASRQYFLRCSWYYSEGYLTNETFLQHFSLWWEPFWGILGLILWYYPLFLRAGPHPILWNVVQMLFVLLWKSMG